MGMRMDMGFPAAGPQVPEYVSDEPYLKGKPFRTLKEMQDAEDKVPYLKSKAYKDGGVMDFE